MLHQLKQWLSAKSQRRGAHRRPQRAGYRGHFERLEARSVLSASTGVTPVALDAIEGAVAQSNVGAAEETSTTANWVNGYVAWESRIARDSMQASPERQHVIVAVIVVEEFGGQSPQGSMSFLSVQGTKLPPAAGIYHSSGISPHWDQPLAVNLGPRPHMLGDAWETFPKTNAYHATGHIVVDDNALAESDIESRPTRNPDSESPPLRAQAAATGESHGPTFVTNSPPSQANSASASNAFSFGTTLVPTTSLASGLYLSSPPPTFDAESPTVASLIGRDAVFQEYANDQLLLTTHFASSGDSESDEEFSGLTEIDEAEDDELAEITDPILYDDKQSSLNAVDRERAAVDKVLAELHNLASPNAGEKQASPDDQSTEAEEQPSLPEAQAPPVHSSGEHSSLSDDAGGMVLLRPSGDANSSVYDLTEIFSNGVADSTGVATDAEASVGMYRAFDVGNAESIPAAGESAPSENPAAAFRPATSAESESANNDRQTS